MSDAIRYYGDARLALLRKIFEGNDGSEVFVLLAHCWDRSNRRGEDRYIGLTDSIQSAGLESPA